MNDETTTTKAPGEDAAGGQQTPGQGTGWTQGPASYGATGYSQTNQGQTSYNGVPPQPSAPSPALAGLLGIIPGVGAIYNGQYAKGVVHLIVFAVLISFTDHVNGIFGFFVAGWIFYMAFEAYHTAVARRDGLPLPNAFNLNDVGERMGFGKNWAAGPNSFKGGQPNPQWNTGTPVDPTAPVPPPAAWGPPVQGPVGSAPSWVGYVPPTAFGAPPPVAPYTAPYGAPPVPPPTAQTVASHVPYAETYTGTPYDPAMAPASTGKRFPVAAFWLIGLGVMFSLSNWIPFWRISGLWILAALFAGLAAWTLVRRMGLAGGVHYTGPTVCVLRGPVVLFTLAIIFALQAAHIATFGQTWSLLLVALGIVLLLERTVGATPMYAPPVSGVTPTSTDDDSLKGGN